MLDFCSVDQSLTNTLVIRTIPDFGRIITAKIVGSPIFLAYWLVRDAAHLHGTIRRSMEIRPRQDTESFGYVLISGRHRKTFRHVITLSIPKGRSWQSQT